jgi:hypothetical protein
VNKRTRLNVPALCDRPAHLNSTELSSVGNGPGPLGHQPPTSLARALRQAEKPTVQPVPTGSHHPPTEHRPPHAPAALILIARRLSSKPSSVAPPLCFSPFCCRHPHSPVHRGPMASCHTASTTGCCPHAPSLPRECPRPQVKLRCCDVPPKHSSHIRCGPHH